MPQTMPLVSALQESRNAGNASSYMASSALCYDDESHAFSNESSVEQEQGVRIQVAVRIRPEKELDGGNSSRRPMRRSSRNESPQDGVAWLVEPEDLAASPSSFTMREAEAKRNIADSTTFSLDMILNENASTRTVYDQVAKSIIEGVATGRNGTIFAYGASGSGKTFTMQGKRDGCKGTKTEGIIQIAARDLFASLEESACSMDSTVTVQYFEVYNEQVRDLLSVRGQGENKAFRDSAFSVEDEMQAGRSKKLLRGSSSSTILTASTASISSFDSSFEPPQGSEFIEKQAAVSPGELVMGVDDVIRILKKGNRNRATAVTSSNQHSSRSHAIFRMTVSCRGVDPDDTFLRVSTLNLVDLAGSENCKVSGVTGAQKVETGKINQSLLALSRVIQALSLPEKKRPKHIGYRNSKLTRILQPHLSGNAGLAVLCCVSASRKHLEETRSTLKFASNAKMIRVKPQVNTIVSCDQRIHHVRKELEETREALRKLREAYEIASRAASSKALVRRRSAEKSTHSSTRSTGDSSSCLSVLGDEVAPFVRESPTGSHQQQPVVLPPKMVTIPSQGYATPQISDHLCGIMPRLAPLRPILESSCETVDDLEQIEHRSKQIVKKLAVADEEVAYLYQKVKETDLVRMTLSRTKANFENRLERAVRPARTTQNVGETLLSQYNLVKVAVVLATLCYAIGHHQGVFAVIFFLVLSLEVTAH